MTEATEAAAMEALKRTLTPPLTGADRPALEMLAAYEAKQGFRGRATKQLDWWDGPPRYSQE